MKSLCIVILILTAAFPTFAQTKTIGNADFEKFRQKRVESEKKLIEDYRRLGFPSPAEIDRQNQQRRVAMEQYSDQLRRQRAESQNGIVTQANTLRIQIASINAQINYVRGQGNTYNNQGFVYAYGSTRYGNHGNRSVLPQIARLPPNMRTVQEYAAMYPSSQSIYDQSIGNAPLGGIVGNGRGAYRGFYISPIIVGSGSYGQTEANLQLIYLEQTRAGLLAQWSILEEQARRAGIRID